MLEGLKNRFPPLYECSVCGKPVQVMKLTEGEPGKRFSCEHTTAKIWANRKVTLRGKGTLEEMPAPRRAAIRLTMTVRQFLSNLTGRSV